MNPEPSNPLIAEADLRAALLPERPDRESFLAGVLAKMAAGDPDQRSTLATRDGLNPIDEDNAGWLRVAAAVLPLPMLGGTLKAAPLAAVKAPLTAKFLGAIALPAACLLALVGALLFGASRIRKAQVDASDEPLDESEVEPFIADWWSGNGFASFAICLLALAMPFLGLPIPMTFVLLASAVAVVWLVVRMGRAGLVDRATIAGQLAAMLGLLGQVLFLVSMGNQGVHLLDQGLVLTMVYLTAIVVGAFSSQRLGGISRSFLITISLGMALWFGSSLLWPNGIASLQSRVESFDHARFSSASWRKWAYGSQWLQAKGVEVDLTKPRGLLESELSGEQNPYLLGAAFRGGLLDQATALRVNDLEEDASRLLDDDPDDPIRSVEQRAYLIRVLACLERLGGDQRDLLESRLLATLDTLPTRRIYDLTDVLVTVESLAVIGRPLEDPVRIESLRELVAEFQCMGGHFGARTGGFAAYSTTRSSDDDATVAALTLMEHVGVPDGIDWLAVRSYARPSFEDVIITSRADLRLVMQQRIDALPDVPPLTWWDYARCEHALGMAIALLVLSLLAVLGSPARPEGGPLADAAG